MIDGDYLFGKGFREANADWWVLKAEPRIGYNVETHELIIGYSSVGGRVTESWQMDYLLKALLIEI